MKSIIFLAVFIFSSQLLSSQKPDTLVVKLNDYGNLSIYSSDLIKEKNNGFSIDQIYRKIYNEISKQNFAGFGNSVLINCSIEQNEISEIKITNAEVAEKEIFIKEGKTFSFDDYKIEIRIMVKNSLKNKVSIFVKDENYFQNILNCKMDSLYTLAIEDIEKEDISKRVSYKMFYSSLDNKLQIDNKLHILGKSEDVIYLTLQPGISIINSTFVPELALNVDFSFSKKGIKTQKFGISNNYYYFPAKDNFFSNNIYNFINLTYSYSIKNSNNKTSGAKLIAGLNMTKNGELFDKNTCRMAIEINHSNIAVSYGVLWQYKRNNDFSMANTKVIGFSFRF